MSHATPWFPMAMAFLAAGLGAAYFAILWLDHRDGFRFLIEDPGKHWFDVILLPLALCCILADRPWLHYTQLSPPWPVITYLALLGFPVVMAVVAVYQARAVLLEQGADTSVVYPDDYSTETKVPALTWPLRESEILLPLDTPPDKRFEVRRQKAMALNSALSEWMEHSKENSASYQQFMVALYDDLARRADSLSANDDAARFRDLEPDDRLAIYKHFQRQLAATAEGRLSVLLNWRGWFGWLLTALGAGVGAFIIAWLLLVAARTALLGAPTLQELRAAYFATLPFLIWVPLRSISVYFMSFCSTRDIGSAVLIGCLLSAIAAIAFVAGFYSVFHSIWGVAGSLFAPLGALLLALFSVSQKAPWKRLPSLSRVDIVISEIILVLALLLLWVLSLGVFKGLKAD